MTGSRTLLLAAGGTAGHVFPALALAQAATAEGFDAVLLGARGGMEERLASEAHVPFEGVAAGKWDRQRPDPRQAIAALRGLGGAVALARRLSPEAVVGFGGFASFPGCVAAALTRTPLVLHEGNAFPGRVTRLFAGRARAVALAWPEAAARLPRARRTEPVGYPVRERRVPRARARAELGLPDEGLLTLVMGGSQGSLALNASVPAAFRRLPPERRGSVLHASGARWEADVREATSGLPGYHVTGFVDATLAWSAADLAITRAGVGTLSDAAFHGVPLVMVPLPTAADDHQRHNARAVAEAGAGRTVEQGDEDALVHAWDAYLGEAPRNEASRRSASRTPAGAAERLLALVTEVAGRSESARFEPREGMR